MTGTVLQYDPKQYTLIIGGKIISGFADDSFIDVERDEEAWSKKVGVGGEVTRAKNNNRTGKIKFRLMQSSASNDDLTAFALADEATGAGAVPCLSKDGSGRSAFATDFGWVNKFPKASFAKGVSVWEWVIDTGNLEMFVGGN